MFDKLSLLCPENPQLGRDGGEGRRGFLTSSVACPLRPREQSAAPGESSLGSEQQQTNKETNKMCGV